MVIQSLGFGVSTERFFGIKEGKRKRETEREPCETISREASPAGCHKWVQEDRQIQDKTRRVNK
jgi:hypothetical protein